MRSHYAAALALILASGAGTVRADTTWVPGVNYFLIEPARPTSVPPGKVEVTEVFSYGCPACNAFVAIMRQLKQSLPANAVVDFVPAAFQTSEDWPMFQQAYITAQALGVADKAHEAMFDAVWKTGELAIIDPNTQALKSPPPSIEDAARFYARQTGVPAATFMNMAKSMPVDMKIKGDNDLMIQYRIDRTPTIIVNGKYRLHTESAGGSDKLIELVNYLVAKETQASPSAPPASPRTH
jgi:protein dithiol oxidoreductase (disulfide-forming)